LFARALQPAEVGSYHLAVFLGTLGATLATFGLPSAATKFIAGELGAGTDRSAAVARRVGWVAAVGLAAVCAAGAGALFAAPASWRPAGAGAILGLDRKSVV